MLVTGASTGIGECLVKKLDGLGYRVLGGVRKQTDADRLKAVLSNAFHPIELDVTDPDHIAALRDSLARHCGDHGLTGLINNAGIALGGPIEYIPLDLVRRQFEVNVFGLLAVTQACLPSLRVARGRIVNIGSIAGLATSPLVTPYCMSKHALESLTDGLRLELADAGIQVAVVEPGPVKTPIWEKGMAQMADAERTLPPIAMERYGKKLAFFGKVLAANNDAGVPAELVADAAIHALQSPSPRTRYLIGGQAKVRAFIARYLPDRWGDALIRTALARMEKRLAR